MHVQKSVQEHVYVLADMHLYVYVLVPMEVEADSAAVLKRRFLTELGAHQFVRKTGS